MSPGAAGMAGSDALDRLPLRLHVDELRLEGVSPLLGGATADELAAEISRHLAQLVRDHGTPPPGPSGGLYLDGASIHLPYGTSRQELAPAIAWQLFEEIHRAAGTIDPVSGYGHGWQDRVEPAALGLPVAAPALAPPGPCDDTAGSDGDTLRSDEEPA